VAFVHIGLLPSWAHRRPTLKSGRARYHSVVGRDHLRLTVRAEGYALSADAHRAGRDIVVVLTGGNRPHVGCVVLATAHPSTADPGRTTVTSSVLAQPPHREEALARPLAESLARTLDCVVVVAAGVHADALTPVGIEVYRRLGEELTTSLLAGFADQAPSRSVR
jgi:hypothetical protein